MLTTNMRQLDFCLVQLPAGSQKATVLVAVRVTQHDLLLITASGQQFAVGGYLEQAIHRCRTLLQVFNGFKERDDVDVELRPGLPTMTRTEQTGFLEEQGKFEQVGNAISLGNNAVGQRCRTVALAQFASGEKDRQFALAYLFHPSTDVYTCPLAMTDGAAQLHYFQD